MSAPAPTVLTGWYPGGVKPQRVGVYQRRYVALGFTQIGFSRWDGRVWLTQMATAEYANTKATAKSDCQDLEWRGFSFDPAEPFDGIGWLFNEHRIVYDDVLAAREAEQHRRDLIQAAYDVVTLAE